MMALAFVAVVALGTSTPTTIAPIAVGFLGSMFGLAFVSRAVRHPSPDLVAQALDDSERRYRELVERAVDGIFTSDEQGIVLDANPSACAIIGRRRDEVVGRHLREFLSLDETEVLAKVIGGLGAGDVVVHEWRLRRPDGTYVPVEVSATRLPDGRMQGITRDITPRKRAEEDLRRLVRQQRLVAELGQHALAGDDLSGLVEKAVTLAAAGLGTPYGRVLELAPDRSALQLRAAVGWAPALVGVLRVAAGRDTQAGFTLLADAAVVVEDLLADPRFTSSSLVGDAGVVSSLSVVIRGSGRPFGVLEVHATERRHFTADDVHFVEGMANVLAQAIVRRSTDEALQTSELRYRLAARATHDAMYDWDIAGDQTFWSEGIKLLFGHQWGARDSGLEWWKDYIHPDDRAAMLRRVEETLRAGLREWRGEYRFQRADGTYAEVHDRGYIEYASDGTPLRAVGAMTDVTEEKRAAAALRRQVAFVALSREVAATANQAVGVADAVRATLRLVCQHTGWPVGHARLFDGGRAAPPPSLWHCDDAERFAALRALVDATIVRRGAGMIGAVWETGRPAWNSEGQAGWPKSVAEQGGLLGHFALPVLVGTRVVGVLEFFSDDGVPPGDDLVAVMAGIGTQLGRVIERARADEDLRDYTERLETLSRRLIETQETERRHVARELHDEIGQALTALKLNLQSIGASVDGPEVRSVVAESLLIADRTLQQTRDLSLDLRPAVLDDLGLIPALRWYLDRQGQRAGFATEFSASEVGDEVPSDVATTCFRVAQEALTNVARHAQASRVVMALDRRGDLLELVVRDSGRGFDQARAAARAASGGSLGLLGMGERAALIGGTLAIDSAPGRGTEVRVCLPLPAAMRRTGGGTG